MATNRADIHVRIPPELLDRLNRVADTRVVSRSVLVERAVEYYLDALDAQLPLEPLAALEPSDGPVP